MGVLQVPFGTFMVGYGLIVPRTLRGHLVVEGVALVVVGMGLAALRFGAAVAVGTLLDLAVPIPPGADSGSDFPALVYGFPFLSLGASCFAFAIAVAETGGDEGFALPFFAAGIALLVLALLVPLFRSLVRALVRSGK